MIYEVVALNNGKISSPTLEWTGVPSKAIAALSKCRLRGKTILKVAGGIKTVISVPELKKMINVFAQEEAKRKRNKKS
jgi:hypothetical protein